MATSRTGTAKYKRNSARVLHAAQAQGLTHCPCTSRRCKNHTGRRCNVPLDYENRKRPNGASVDHVHAHARGGTDDVDNLTILCLRCNIATGDKQPRKRPSQVQSYTPTTGTGRRAGRPPGA